MSHQDLHVAGIAPVADAGRHAVAGGELYAFKLDHDMAGVGGIVQPVGNIEIVIVFIRCVDAEGMAHVMRGAVAESHERAPEAVRTVLSEAERNRHLAARGVSPAGDQASAMPVSTADASVSLLMFSTPVITTS